MTNDILPTPVTTEQQEALAVFLRADAARITALNKLAQNCAGWLSGAVPDREWRSLVKDTDTCHRQTAAARSDYRKMMGLEA